MDEDCEQSEDQSKKGLLREVFSGNKNEAERLNGTVPQII